MMLSYINSTIVMIQMVGFAPSRKGGVINGGVIIHRRGLVHPIPITRFRSFRTQPLENLSAAAPPSNYLSNKCFWATQPLAQVSRRKILWWELGVILLRVSIPTFYYTISIGALSARKASELQGLSECFGQISSAMTISLQSVLIISIRISSSCGSQIPYPNAYTYVLSPSNSSIVLRKGMHAPGSGIETNKHELLKAGPSEPVPRIGLMPNLPTNIIPTVSFQNFKFVFAA